MNTDFSTQRRKAAKSCPEKSPLTAKSRGRGWDCVRQMQLFRRRPDVLAAALRDMGVLPDEHYEGEPQEEDDYSQN